MAEGAELLRKAAKRMRERAEAATPGPWRVSNLPNDAVGCGTVFAGSFAGPRNLPWADAEHIASWHPAVALAVADWLVAEAVAAERHEQRDTTRDVLPPFPVEAVARFKPALAVARAFLAAP